MTKPRFAKRWEAVLFALLWPACVVGGWLLALLGLAAMRLNRIAITRPSMASIPPHDSPLVFILGVLLFAHVLGLTLMIGEPIAPRAGKIVCVVTSSLAGLLLGFAFWAVHLV